MRFLYFKGGYIELVFFTGNSFIESGFPPDVTRIIHIINLPDGHLVLGVQAMPHLLFAATQPLPQRMEEGFAALDRHTLSTTNVTTHMKAKRVSAIFIFPVCWSLD